MAWTKLRLSSYRGVERDKTQRVSGFRLNFTAAQPLASQHRDPVLALMWKIIRSQHFPQSWCKSQNYALQAILLCDISLFH